MVDVHRRRAVDPLAMGASADPHRTTTTRIATVRRQIAAVSVTCLLIGWCAAAIARDSISASEAAKLLGETATVCGEVASAKYVSTSKGRPTFLNLDRPYPDQAFTVVIWGEDRERFAASPESAFADKAICVTGQIEAYRGKPQVVVRDPNQIVERKGSQKKHL